MYVTFSGGVSPYPNDGENLEKIIGFADRAMKYTKQYDKFQILFAKNIPEQKKEYI